LPVRTKGLEADILRANLSRTDAREFLGIAPSRHQDASDALSVGAGGCRARCRTAMQLDGVAVLIA
jgi:hypothetical protein